MSGDVAVFLGGSRQPAGPLRRRAWLAALLLAACAGIGTGCQEDENALSGSVDEVYDLSYQTVRARQYDSEFAIEYTREDGQIPVRVIVERDADEPISEGAIDLAERGTVVGRVGPRTLPEFRSGTLNLETYRSAQGAPVEGSFDATLRSEDATYSLSGVFSTHLDIVDGSIGYRFPDAGDAASDLGASDGAGSDDRADGTVEGGDGAEGDTP